MTTSSSPGLVGVGSTLGWVLNPMKSIRFIYLFIYLFFNFGPNSRFMGCVSS